MKLLIPTSVVTPFGADTGITVFAFGKMLNEAPNGWKFGVDGQKNESVEEQIAEFAFDYNVNTILAPIPDFSGTVCHPEQLSHHSDYQFGRCEKVVIKRNVKADGVLLPRGQAFFLPTADCHTLLVYDTRLGELVCGHAGRESVYDKARIQGRGRRKHESLVHSMLEVLNTSPEHIRAFVGYGIGRNNFIHSCTDSPDAEWNIRMRTALATWDESLRTDSQCRISVRQIIKGQLAIAGVIDDHVALDNVDTFSDQREDGTGPRWWSNRRGDKTERNGILVIYNP